MRAEGPLATPTIHRIEETDKHMAILVHLKENGYTEADIYDGEIEFYTEPSNLFL